MSQQQHDVAPGTGTGSGGGGGAAFPEGAREKPLNNGYLQANAPLEDLNATVVSPLLGQQQQQPQLQQQQNKLPTVVFLAPDGSGGVGVGSALQRNPGTSLNPGSAAQQRSSSDWLLKESQQRRRLLVLAIAFTVLGAAIGALAIYFASVHQRCQMYHRSLEPGECRRL